MFVRHFFLFYFVLQCVWEQKVALHRKGLRWCVPHCWGGALHHFWWPQVFFPWPLPIRPRSGIRQKDPKSSKKVFFFFFLQSMFFMHSFVFLCVFYFFLQKDMCQGEEGSFRVLVENEACGIVGHRCAKSITISYQGGLILMQQGEVKYNIPMHYYLIH